MDQLAKAPIVLVRDRLNTHVSRAVRKMIDDRDDIRGQAPPERSGCQAGSCRCTFRDFAGWAWNCRRSPYARFTVMTSRT